MTDVKVEAWDPDQARALEMPRWEYGGTFRQAWEGARYLMDWPALQPVHRTWMAAQLFTLSHAHVATLDPDQFEALPRRRDDLVDYDPDPHLPFQVMYVSIGHPDLAGILLVSNEQRVVATPYMAKIVRGFPGAMPLGWLDLSQHQYVNYLERIWPKDWKKAEDDPGFMAYATDAVVVMRFLESSNVDLEDTPVSRQVRRKAQRTGAPIAQRVYVRSSRHRRTNGHSEHEHIEFSHRFEVRGHYKHFGPDTQLFKATQRDRPHKIIEHPTRGPMVRIWCPDFVKGPEEKPLVPKTRTYKTPTTQEEDNGDQ